MNPGPKYILIGSLMIATLAAALCWSWQYFADERSAAFAAAEEAESCERLAEQIAGRRRTVITNTREPARQLELTRRIARAAVDARIPARALDRVDNDPPRHTQGGPNLERPTRIVLRGVTLRQLVTLLHSVDRPSEGLRIERIHLSTPPDSPDSQSWSAESTLLQVLPDQSNPATTSER